MAFNLSSKIYPEPLRYVDYPFITMVYAPLGSPFANPVRIFWLQNQTDVTIFCSFDGVTDHFVLPSKTFLLLDITTNSSLPAGSLYFAQGQRLYIASPVSPTTGTVYLSVFYGVNN